MFGSIGMPELIIILTIALIIFGPRKLPELGRSLGKSLGEFKRASNELRNTLDEEIRIEEERSTRPAPSGDAAPEPAPVSSSGDRRDARRDRATRLGTRVARDGARSALERPLPQSAHDDDDSLIELTDPQEVELDAGRMSFLEHLDELRKRLIAGIIGIAVGCVASFIFLDKYIFPFIMLPMQRMLPEGGKLITTEASEFFMLWIKVGFFAGLLIAMPFILCQVWLFVAPGLYSHEKRFAIPFVLFASIFFFGGAMFSHYVAFPVTWGFFITFNPSFVHFMPKIGPAFALYVKMLLACGAVFQMPVLVFALARMGMVTAGFLLRNFKYAVLIIAILGAVLSPGGDIASQMILAGPMLVLYIISIGVAWAFQKRKPAAEAAS